MPTASSEANVGASRVCSRCVMDRSDPAITFDRSGVCSHCDAFEKRARDELLTGSAGERKLRGVAAKIKGEGKGAPYDCLIGVSGGLDSTMVAYVVKKELGLRPLAVHFDNGWNTELAVHNIKRTLDRLSIDLHTHVVDWDEFRRLQISFLRASVPNAEIPTDHGIVATMFGTAAKLGIKHIISGGNLASEGILPPSWGHVSQDLCHLRAVHRRFGGGRLKTFPTLRLTRFVHCVLVRGIRYVPILNYIDYNIDASTRLLRKELDWRPYGGKHYESVFTRFFQGYILPVKFGIDKRKAHYSALIRSEQLTREAALARLEEDPYAGHDLDADLAFVLKKLGLSAKEFSTILGAPPRAHTDFASNTFILERISWGRRWFTRYAKDV